jgi:hypothetical protein
LVQPWSNGQTEGQITKLKLVKRQLVWRLGAFWPVAGVVQGDGQIPYKPEALQIKKENAEHWIDRDPELKCYLPGIPRAMYLPYPFQITQSTNKIHMAYEFSNTARTIHLDKVEGPPTIPGWATRSDDGMETRSSST